MENNEVNVYSTNGRDIVQIIEADEVEEAISAGIVRRMRTGKLAITATGLDRVAEVMAGR